MVGIFDIVGTIFSGWLTDRYDPRFLLAMYYTLRGVSLFLLPSLFGDEVTSACWRSSCSTASTGSRPCRRRWRCAATFGDRGPVVFGWVFASHQIGAAAAAVGAGVVRDQLGTYDLAWYVAGTLCVVAASFCVAIRYRHTP